MKLSLPVIASSRGGIPEIVGEYRYSFDPYEHGDLEKCILQFQNDPIVQVQKQVKNLTDRLPLFTSERMAKDYSQLFNSLL